MKTRSSIMPLEPNVLATPLFHRHGFAFASDVSKWTESMWVFSLLVKTFNQMQKLDAFEWWGPESSSSGWITQLVGCPILR